MKERPIIFSGEMVRAILEGRKTQTRRVVKPQPDGIFDNGIPYIYKVVERINRNFETEIITHNKDGHPFVERVTCLYGEPGDRLWVRETWAYCSKCSHKQPEKPEGVIYKADGDGFSTCHVCDPKSMQPDYRWRPSIFMPRWASRITLEVKNVRVERLQDISESDAEAEGVGNKLPIWIGERKTTFEDEFTVTSRDKFHDLWDTINAKRGYGWDTNPWVWVVKFEVVND